MAIITWQNVGQPDFGSSQAGFRTGVDLINRAAQSAEGVVAGAQAMNARELAGYQQNAEKQWTDQLLAAQTPEQLDALKQRGFDVLPDGTKIDPNFVTPEMLLKVQARRDMLVKQGQEQAKFGEEQKTWAQNALDRNDKNWQSDRTKELVGIDKQIAPFFDQLAPIARKDPASAIKQFAQQTKGIDIPLAVREDVVKRFNDLYEKPNYEGARLRADMEKTKIMKDADAAIKRIVGMNGNPDAITPFFDSLDPTVAGVVADEIERRKIYPDFKATYFSKTPTFGGGPTSSGAIDPGIDVPGIERRIRGAATTLGRKLDDPMRIVLAAQGKETLSADMAADELTAKINSGIKDKSQHWDNAKVRSAVGDLLRQTANAEVPLTPAEAAGLVSLYTEGDDWTTVSNLSSGTDIRQTALYSQAKKIVNARSGADQYTQDQAALRTNEKRLQTYNELKQLVNSTQRAADLGREDAKKNLPRLEKMLKSAAQALQPESPSNPAEPNESVNSAPNFPGYSPVDYEAVMRLTPDKGLLSSSKQQQEFDGAKEAILRNWKNQDSTAFKNAVEVLVRYGAMDENGNFNFE